MGITSSRFGVNSENQPIFARIDDDDIIRFTCTGENPEYQQWLASINN